MPDPSSILSSYEPIFAAASWWPTATLATHLLIATALLWWLWDSRKQRRAREELSSAVAAFDRLFEVTSGMANDVEDHFEKMQALHQQLDTWKKQQPAKKSQSDILTVVEQLLESNLWLMQRIGAAETQLVDQRAEIQRHASAAQRDSLTGLWNRRAFDLAMQRHLAAWREQQTPVVLLLIDVDFFKQINDGFGHPAGDRVLKTVVQVISRAVRSTDALYRFGGDELALILGGATLENGCKVAEKIRAAVARLGRFTDLGVTLSISCGLAAATQEEDAAALLRRADGALFASKEQGRNRVSMHDGQACQPVTGERQSGIATVPATSGGPQTAVLEAPPQGSMEALDAACDALQQRLNEISEN